MFNNKNKNKEQSIDCYQNDSQLKALSKIENNNVKVYYCLTNSIVYYQTYLYLLARLTVCLEPPGYQALLVAIGGENDDNASTTPRAV